MEDWYSVLGLSSRATTDEIRKAFHSLARKVHPDKAAKETQEFLEIREAYKVLSDPIERKKYDEERSELEKERIKKEDGAVPVTVDEFEVDAETGEHVMECRCGGMYGFVRDEIDHGINVIECDGCS
eukprot:CAMPEP_0113907252 /NCGR_PEP_ID=MMETSP0780_2-20120614/25353_1 /TAXON_ID=652834 /ORGANISM="Palpitomonas bilix" /LENGTH=126 /DNA_ID=CAMNT_0000902249 /DNA_START=76 /DNA_END=452 /DNA_ORIENTATION=- /assembly_acc=CAM_ASM_000599